MTARFRINPLSFVRGRELVFQHRQRVGSLGLDPTAWSMLRPFYHSPSLAPRSVVLDSDPSPLVTTGILIPEHEIEPFLRAERSVSWMPDKSTIHLLLAAFAGGNTAWFEHTGQAPILLFGRNGRGQPWDGGLFTYDGHAFGFESPGASAIADSKAATSAFLKGAGYRVAPQITVPRAAIPREGTAVARRRFITLALLHRPSGFRFPAVVKPISMSVGAGVEFADNEDELAKHLIRLARQFPSSRAFVVETAIKGREWRVTVFADGTHAAYERTPFRVTGDGRSTIRGLVTEQHRWRRLIVERRGYMRPPSRLRIGARERQMLAAQSLTLDSVPPLGARPAIVARPHATLGGIYRDATADLPESLVEMLHGIRAQMDLTRAGFDLIGRSFDERHICIIEVNGRPSLWTHIEPDVGVPRPVARTMIEIGFQEQLRAGAARSVLEICRNARRFGTRVRN